MSTKKANGTKFQSRPSRSKVSGHWDCLPLGGQLLSRARGERRRSERRPACSERMTSQLPCTARGLPQQNRVWRRSSARWLPHWPALPPGMFAVCWAVEETQGPEEIQRKIPEILCLGKRSLLEAGGGGPVKNTRQASLSGYLKLKVNSSSSVSDWHESQKIEEMSPPSSCLKEEKVVCSLPERKYNLLQTPGLLYIMYKDRKIDTDTNTKK